jgi:DNA polymerase elongation subunit (family B)
MKEIGYEVIYTDTDALMYKADKDETDLLNQLVTKWAKEKYNKDDIDITFESEGKFDKILILGKCHYYGIKGNKKEIKGMEIKRSSSSKYEAWFQETLIQKILNKEDKDNIIQWIKIEKENLSSRPIFETAFPCKIATREYKNNPIFIRAYNNSQKLFKNFKINKGELYHYIFVIPTMKDERNKPVNVIAIKENINLDQIKIDWKEMTRRNIMMKANALFEALGWEMLTTDDDRQLQFDLFGKEERTCKKII